METWYLRVIVLQFSAKRVDVKNSWTERCEKCTNGESFESSALTSEINVEQVDSTAWSGSSRPQSSRNFGMGPSLKSNARNPASSLARRGREATATHWNILW